jgi:peptidyl-prolyl cis-trans isomerase A (cyclophilin A)
VTTPRQAKFHATPARDSRASALVRVTVLSGLLALAAAAPALAQKVRLATSAGDIVLELNKEKAPKSVDNFVQYVKAGHYDSTIFHRVIDGFMIQGGGMTADMREKPTRAPIPLESHNGLSNVRGALAMARTAAPNSATAQFFINVKDNPFLDQGDGYAVFGKVISGMDVVDKIRTTPTRSDVPITTITIKKASIEE